MLIIVLNLLMCSNYELISICNQQCTKSVKWSCSFEKIWQWLLLGQRLFKIPNIIGYLNCRVCLIVQFVVHNLHFHYCCIKLKLSLGKKYTFVYNKSQASFFSIAVFTPTTSILEQNIPPCSLLYWCLHCTNSFSESSGTYWHTEVPVKLRGGKGAGQDKAGGEHFSSRWLHLQRETQIGLWEGATL